MLPSEIPFAVFLFWIAAVIVIVVYFTTRRVMLGRKRETKQYPYAYYKRRKRDLTLHFGIALLLSVVIACTTVLVWEHFVN